MSSIKKFLRWLDINLEPVLMMITFLIMLTLICVQVIRRFAFGEGFAWGEEIATFIFAWVAFLGISYVFRNNKHISVDFVKNMLPEKYRKIIAIIVDIMMIISFTILLIGAIENVMNSMKFGDTAVSLPISMNWLFSSAVMGFSLSTFRILQTLIWKIMRFNASYELFMNVGGIYNGSHETFFIPKESREELESLINQEILQEEINKTYRKTKGGNI